MDAGSLAAGRAAEARASFAAAKTAAKNAVAETNLSVKQMMSLRSLQGLGNNRKAKHRGGKVDEAAVAAEAEEAAAIKKSSEARARLRASRSEAENAEQEAAKLVAKSRVASIAVARAIGPASVRLAENFDGCWWDGELLASLLRSAAPDALAGAPGAMLRKTLDPAEKRGHCVAALARLSQKPTEEGGPSKGCLPTALELSQGAASEVGSRRVRPLVAATLAQMFVGGNSGIAAGEVSATAVATVDANLSSARRRWDGAASVLRVMIADAEAEDKVEAEKAAAAAVKTTVETTTETTAGGSAGDDKTAPAGALKGAGETIVAALAEAEGWRADAVRGHEAYQRVQRRAARFAFDACGAALREETPTLVDESEERSLSRFSHVDAEQIDDCLRERNVGGTKASLDHLPSGGSGGGLSSSSSSSSSFFSKQAVSREVVEAARRKSADEINGVLREHAALLRDVFSFYSISAADMQGGSAGASSTVTMSSPEFWRFVKDIRVVDGKALISSQVDLIFIAANNDLRTGLPRQEADNSASELLPHEFVEALTRLAARKFAGSGKADVHDCLRKLIVDVIKPRACRSDSNHFRALLVSAPVQGVFARHRRALERVFMHYATQDKSMGSTAQKGVGNTINYTEFVIMCKECQLFDNAFTELVAGVVFANVQQDEVEQSGVSVGGGYGEMVFSEFLEAVGAVCMYKCPMPYEPLEQRLEQFISGSVLRQRLSSIPFHSIPFLHSHNVLPSHVLKASSLNDSSYFDRSPPL